MPATLEWINGRGSTRWPDTRIDPAFVTGKMRHRDMSWWKGNTT